MEMKLSNAQLSCLIPWISGTKAAHLTEIDLEE